MVFRCTAKLTRRFGVILDAPENAESTNLLGDWYANVLNVGAQRWVLCLNAPTNLPVLVRARRADFPEEFPVELGLVLRRIGVPPEVAAAESMRSSEFRFGRTVSKSILGSLNDMVYHMEDAILNYGDPVAAAVSLAEMPSRGPRYIHPGEQVYDLLGIPSLFADRFPHSFPRSKTK